MGAEKETEHFFLEQRRLIRVCTCRHSRENILTGLNCFQRLSAVDTCTFDCGHKLGAELWAEKKNIMLTFFSSSECAHDGAKI